MFCWGVCYSVGCFGERNNLVFRGVERDLGDVSYFSLGFDFKDFCVNVL